MLAVGIADRDAPARDLLPGNGHPIVSSYGALGFDFANPGIYGVLFSVQKGLFFWSPLLLLACAGLAWLGGQDIRRGHSSPAEWFSRPQHIPDCELVGLAVRGSFGHRGFTDSLPIFAIGLAAAVHLVGAPDDDGRDRSHAWRVLRSRCRFSRCCSIGRRAALQRHDVGSVRRGVPEDEVRRSALAIVACLARRGRSRVPSRSALARNAVERLSQLGDRRRRNRVPMGRRACVIVRALQRARSSHSASDHLRSTRRVADHGVDHDRRPAGGSARTLGSGLARKPDSFAATWQQARAPGGFAHGSHTRRQPGCAGGTGSHSRPGVDCEHRPRRALRP